MLITSTQKKSSNWILRFYITFFCIYNLQGSLYANGSILSQGALLIILILGLIGLYKQLFKRIPIMMVRLMIVFLMLLVITYLISPKIVIGSLHEAIGKVFTFDQFKKEVVFCIQFFIGMLIAQKSEVKPKSFLFITILLIVVSIVGFYHVSRTLMLERGNMANTINVAYQFVILLPFIALAFQKYRKVSLICLFTILFFVVLGAKRGAIVCLGAAILYGIYWYNKYIHLKLYQRLVGLMFVCILFGFAYHQYTANDYLQNRVAKTESSGIGAREIAYSSLLDHWVNDDSLITMIIGNGTAQTVNVWGNYGHNDWLELLIDNGILGVVVYVSIFLSAYHFINKRMKNRYYQLACNMCLIIWFLKSCFSMGYTDLYAGILLSVLGYCLERTKIDNLKNPQLQYEQNTTYYR